MQQYLKRLLCWQEMEGNGMNKSNNISHESSPYQYFHQNKKTVKGNTNRLYKQLQRIYLGNQCLTDLSQLIKFPKVQTVKKEVCSKLFVSGQSLVQCYDCRTDETCVICQECFKNGNHEGHKFRKKKSSGGCCDCGDREAWKEEGFCKRHSGKFQEIQIEKGKMEEIQKIMFELFYLYIYLNTKKTNNKDSYNDSLIKFLIQKNNNNHSYNKITATILTKKLPACTCGCTNSNPLITNCTILENILNFSISETFIKQWWELFMLMFSYYPFKQQLIKCYIVRFGWIVNGEDESIECANCISCQILTSYQLVQRYSQNNSIGLGQGSPVPPLEDNQQLSLYKQYYNLLFYDLYKISNLKNNASLKYWKMHINSNKSINNLYNYYPNLLKLNENFKRQSMNNLSIVLNVIDMSKIQHEGIKTLIKILNIIKNEKQCMNKVIKLFWNQCIKYQQRVALETLFIFRTYERCFVLVLFALFECSFSDIQQKIQNLIKSILNVTNKQFLEIIKKIFSKLLYTYLICARSTSFPGFGLSIRTYLYFYKFQYQQLSSTDIVGIKLLLLIINKLQNESTLVCNEVFVQFQKLHRQCPLAQLKYEKIELGNQLKFIKYLYVNQLPQIFLTYEIYSDSTFYDEDIIELLERMFCESKGKIGYEQIKIIISKVFPSNVKCAKQWIKKKCQLNKQKKQFQYKQYKENERTINFSDIWQNNLQPENSKFSDPLKTMQLIKKHNLQVFSLIWTSESIKVLTSIMRQLTKQSKDSIQLILENILHVYLMKQQLESGSAGELKKQIILPNISKIPMEIAVKFKQLNGNYEVEEKIGLISVEEEILEQRRTKSDKMKEKKLEKFRKTQIKFLSNTENMTNFQITIDKNEKMQQIPQQQQQTCSICRNKDQSQLIYLVSIQPRNHEKLLKWSKNGQQCVSFYSCCHTFDWNCIKNLQKKKLINLYICPLCKCSANLLLPLYPSKHKNDVIDQILEMIGTILGIYSKGKKVEIIEQIIKSFYHFGILCSINPKNMMTKKVHLYQILLQIMKIKNINIRNYRSKLLKQDEQDKITQKSKSEIRTTSDENCRNQKMKISNKTSDDFLKGEKQQGKKQEYSSFYKNFMKLFFNMLDSSNYSHLHMEDQQKQKIRILLNMIFEKKFPQKQKTSITNLKLQNLPSIILKLPKKFSQIKKPQLCTSCKQITSETVQCLLCTWVGCQHCQEGKSIYHTLNHGGISPFMAVQSSVAFYQSLRGKSFVGPLYENNWGHRLESNFHWEEFQLNNSKLNSIEYTLLQDKPITYKDGIELYL